MTSYWPHPPPVVPQKLNSSIAFEGNKTFRWKCTFRLIWGWQTQWWRLLLNLSTWWRHTIKLFNFLVHYRGEGVSVWRRHMLKFKNRRHHCLCRPQISPDVPFHHDNLFCCRIISENVFWGKWGLWRHRKVRVMNEAHHIKRLPVPNVCCEYQLVRTISSCFICNQRF